MTWAEAMVFVVLVVAGAAVATQAIRAYMTIHTSTSGPRGEYEADEETGAPPRSPRSKPPEHLHGGRQ